MYVLKESLQGLGIWVEWFLMNMTWKIFSFLILNLPLCCLFSKFRRKEKYANLARKNIEQVRQVSKFNWSDGLKIKLSPRWEVIQFFPFIEQSHYFSLNHFRCDWPYCTRKRWLRHFPKEQSLERRQLPKCQPRMLSKRLEGSGSSTRLSLLVSPTSFLAVANQGPLKPWSRWKAPSSLKPKPDHRPASCECPTHLWAQVTGPHARDQPGILGWMAATYTISLWLGAPFVSYCLRMVFYSLKGLRTDISELLVIRKEHSN